MTHSNDNIPKGLIGSGHKYSMGYGYGARVPTTRNLPTLPASIPQYRYPPVSERSENLFRSRPMGLTGCTADKRHADQIVYQTSGEWGKFLTNNDNADVRLKPVPATLALKKQNNHNNIIASQGLSKVNNNNNTYRESMNSSRYDFNDSKEIKTHRDDINKGKSVYHDTLKNIDFKAFPKHAKYNLIASIQPPVTLSEYRGVATTNQLGYKNCLGWSGQLRN